MCLCVWLVYSSWNHHTRCLSCVSTADHITFHQRQEYNCIVWDISDLYQHQSVRKISKHSCWQCDQGQWQHDGTLWVVSVALLFVFVLKLGIAGVFLAVIVDEIVRSFINLGKYLRIVKNWESTD